MLFRPAHLDELGRSGNCLVESKTKPGTHVLMMPWNTAFNCTDRGLRIVNSGISPGDQLQWEVKNDHWIAVAGLVRQRWPAQEALEEVTDTSTDCLWSKCRS